MADGFLPEGGSGCIVSVQDLWVMSLCVWPQPLEVLQSAVSVQSLSPGPVTTLQSTSSEKLSWALLGHLSFPALSLHLIPESLVVALIPLWRHLLSPSWEEWSSDSHFQSLWFVSYLDFQYLLLEKCLLNKNKNPPQLVNQGSNPKE